MRLKLIISLFVLMNLLSWATAVSAAEYSDYTINNNYSYSVGLSGNTSNSFVRTGIYLSYIYPQMTSDTALTYIKYRVRINGSDNNCDPYLDVTLAGDFNNNGCWGSPASPVLLSTTRKSSIVVGQWYQYSYSFNPNAGAQVGNRMLYLFIDGVDSYDYCSFTIEILEIRYRKYTVDITTSVTPDRYVELKLDRFSGATDTRIAIQNINDGRWIAGSSYSRSTFPGSNTSYSVIDTGVMPEKTYTYYLYYQVGSSTSIPPMGPIVVSVKVPSDATLAVEQTVDAGYSAAQWAHWANDNASLAATNTQNSLNAVSNINGTTITAVRDASGTVLSEARQAKTNAQNAYNTAQSVNTKIDSLTTAVTNIQNTLGVDTSPPEVKITTVSGALATSGSHIRAVVNASDNVSTAFGYSLDGTVYQPLPADGVINLLVNLLGNNLITVWIKDEAGNIGRDSITIRKL